MQLEINKRLYDVYFGIDALDKINNAYAIDQQGMNVNLVVGEGLNFLYFGLEALNPVAVRNFIEAGTSTLKSKPPKMDVENFIVDLIETDKMEEFCGECTDFLKNAPLTRKSIGEMLKEVEREEKKEKKEQKA